MRTNVFGWVAAFGLAFSLATTAIGFTSETGCCSCACPPSGAAEGFDTCQDIAGNESLCDTMCLDMNCTFSFFVNGTECSDPALADTCAATGATMAPAVSGAGVAALAALLAGSGAFYLRRRSA